MKQNVIPVILCGGSGTRLWPASRESHPKQFLNLMGDFSLLQNTMRRALRVTGGKAENLVTVTLGALAKGVISQLAAIDPAATKHVLREPAARNTAAAVAFAAAYVELVFGRHAIMWILPADHHIGDEQALKKSFGPALCAAQEGYLTTFGIRPHRPETGYGYIQLGTAFPGSEVYAAKKFVEKPNAATAQTYLDAGDYLWNSGMFLFSTGALLDEYETYAADILDNVKVSMDKAVCLTEVAEHPYASIAEEPFDKAIMEKSSRVAIVPCDPAWSDIGSWDSLWEIRPKDIHGNVVEGRATCHDTHNCLIQVKDRLVACAGLENIVIIETPDALLISDRRKGDSMRALVKTLKNTGCVEISAHGAPPNPWSLVKPVPANQDFSVREFSVPAGETRHFDPHDQPGRFWTITQGEAHVMADQEERHTKIHETVFIPQGAAHRISNRGTADLKVMEVNHRAAGMFRLGQPRDDRREVA